MGTDRRTVTGDAVSGTAYTLVVAVANPDHVEQLMRTAVDLAEARDGRIQVVSVVHKPVTSPFALFSEDSIRGEFTAGREAVLDDAVAFAEDAAVPVGRSLEVGTDVSDALLSAVRDANADGLLLGWQDQSRPSDVVLGTTVDPVVRRAPCDVYVERVGTTAGEMNAILLPTDGGPHVGPAVELANAVARANDAVVRVVSFVASEAGDAEREAAQEFVEGVAERLASVAVDVDVCEADAVGDAIVAAADDHDLVVLGATRERQVGSRIVGSVANVVGQRASPPIVIAKRRTDESLLERALALWTHGRFR